MFIETYRTVLRGLFFIHSRLNGLKPSWAYTQRTPPPPPPPPPALPKTRSPSHLNVILFVDYFTCVYYIYTPYESVHVRVYIICSVGRYADDLACAGEQSHIHSWLNRLLQLGPAYGYFAEPTEGFLVVAKQYDEEAKELCKERGVIVVSGHRFIGGVIVVSYPDPDSHSSGWITSPLREKFT